ncbi:amidase [Roseimicrobium gellanilyticum]|nr:amidase [Roseimicrobium gellanilyticum]
MWFQSLPLRRGVAALTAVSLLSGCTSSLPSFSNPFPKLRGDKAFIRYWPPPEGSTQLRVAVKDNIDMKGVVTAAGSEYLLKTNPPAEEDAACLAPVRARGVHIVGRTNLNELALGATGINGYFGTPRNRMGDSKRLMPGGSSSGSAVAVLNERADVAIGTDTAGSIRTPAACCGVYGLKTTFGLISTKGIHPISPRHLDTVGPIAKDVPNLVEGMDLLKPGFRSQYMNAMASEPGPRSLTIGRLYIENTDPKIDKAIDDALASANVKVVRLPRWFSEAWKEAMKNGNTIAVADGYVTDKELLKARGVTSTTKAAILLGEFKYDSEDYRKALAMKKVWQRQLDRIFQRVDFIALPTLRHHPMKVPIFSRFVLFEAQALALQNTVSVNYAGNPAVAMPVPMDDKKIPLTSLQLVGPRLSEAKLLNAARILASKR